MKLALIAFCVLLASLLPRAATASEWGCEVLLCAASSNPSWHGVTECHPPMERLISAMKRPDFSWPTCPEGGAGKPGYETFLDCPVGWQPTSDENGGSSELSQCMRKVSGCSALRGGDAQEATIVRRIISDDGRCEFTEYAPRPRRAQPYFFDIEDQDTKTPVRHYFDLQT